MSSAVTVLASLGVVRVDGLLERGDVAEGEQEQHHQLALVADRRHVHQQPQRRACATYHTRMYNIKNTVENM